MHDGSLSSLQMRARPRRRSPAGRFACFIHSRASLDAVPASEMRVGFCGARGFRKCGPPKPFGITAGRPDRAPMLYDMQNKPALAGRPGKSGVRFRLILKRLLRVTNSAGHRHGVLHASCKVASEIGPAVLIACALPGQTKSGATPPLQLALLFEVGEGRPRPPDQLG